MPRGKRLYSYVEVDDRTPVQKLSLLDQCRLILRKLTEDPANELKSEDSVTAEYLKLKADLIDFIKQHTEPIKKGTHKTVVVQISNAFKPVLREVLESAEINKYYNIRIAKPHIDYDIPVEYLLEISIKEN